MPPYNGYTTDAEIASAQQSIQAKEDDMRHYVQRYNDAVAYARGCEHDGRSRSTVKKAWKQAEKWKREVEEREYQISMANRRLDDLYRRRDDERLIEEATRSRFPPEINDAIAREVYYSGRRRNQYYY